ncbi:MAG: phosphatidate cytidylyltransferase [Planctomycetaceae bacterium]
MRVAFNQLGSFPKAHAMETITTNLNGRLLWMIAAVFSALSIGSAARLLSMRGAAADVVRSRIGSLKTWWALSCLLAVAVITAPAGVIILLLVASWLAMEELYPLLKPGPVERGTMVLVFGAIVVNYLLILTNQVAAFSIFLPVVSLLVLSVWRSIGGYTKGYLASTAGLYFAVMVVGFGLSHAALLFRLPVSEFHTLGNIGWFLFLIILTETNDIFQALVGRRIGKHKVTPGVSPNKSWEGCLGGTVATIVVASTLSPYLTPFADRTAMQSMELPVTQPFFWSTLVAVVISFAGFLGDINMSAIKRDAGVKDGSTRLPGQGGVIDRIDSLTFTAPVFYYSLYCLL